MLTTLDDVLEVLDDVIKAAPADKGAKLAKTIEALRRRLS